jgi:hypothetical protein
MFVHPELLHREQQRGHAQLIAELELAHRPRPRVHRITGSRRPCGGPASTFPRADPGTASPLCSGSRNTSAINSSSEMSRMRSVRDRPAG